MIAYRLLSETVDDVMKNPLQAFKISLPTLLAIILIVGFVGGFVGALSLLGAPSTIDANGIRNFETGPLASPVLFTGIAVLIVVFAASIAWTAVAWHRFVCLGETPTGRLPRWPGKLAFGYALRFAGITLLTLLLAIPFGPLRMLADADPEGNAFIGLFGLPEPVTAKNIALSLVLSGSLGALSLLISMRLPAYAVGRPLPPGATTGKFFAVFVPLAFFLSVIFMAMETAAVFLSAGGVSGIILGWLQLMVGIGVLTRAFLHVAPDTGAAPP